VHSYGLTKLMLDPCPWVLADGRPLVKKCFERIDGREATVKAIDILDKGDMIL
jgi:hypothetical protein